MSTEFIGTNEQWARIERFAAGELEDEYSVCLLELRDRLKDLEASNTHRRLDFLRLANAVANQVQDRNKLFADIMPDFAGTSYQDLLEGSLLQRVCDAIAVDPGLARSAILAVAAWIENTQHEHWHAVSRILKFELENFSVES